MRYSFPCHISITMRTSRAIRKYAKEKYTGVAHTTFNPKGPGVVRIHLVPPEVEEGDVGPAVAIINGSDIIPVNPSWTILLMEYIEEGRLKACYDGNDNLLIASEKGTKVENAYRLGYKAGEDYGVAFYKWNSENPDAGIVYIQNPANNSNAKISFVVNDITTSLNSISHKKIVDGSIYSIYGQRRSAIARGINIVNGKKVIVR